MATRSLIYLLDTNVLSALIARSPPEQVLAWVAARPIDQLFTSHICQAEILGGLASMPEGRRRRELEQAADQMFEQDFRGRIFPFDGAAARAFARLFAERRRSGRPIGPADLMIGAIAIAGEAELVTRNVPDFQTDGLTVINPWND